MTAGETARAAARFLLWAGLAFGLAFALLTPPFEVPDEPAHFFRAVAISEGHWRTTQRGAGGGQDLPRWAVMAASDALDSIPGDVTKKSRIDWLTEPSPSAASDRARVFVAVPSTIRVERLGYTAASYSPLPYLAPALAVRTGVLLGLTGVQILLLIRLVNAAIALAIALVAVRVSGPAAPLLALVAMLPMSVFMRSSASADGLTLSIALLLIGLVTGRSWSEEPCSNAQLSALVFVTLLACLTKPVATVLLPLTLPARVLASRARLFRGCVAAALIAGLWLASFFSSDAARAAPALAAQSAQQIDSVLRHPIVFTGTLVRTWSNYLPRYLEEAIGKFGWMDTHLPGPLIVLAWALLLRVGLVNGPPFTARQRLLYWSLAVSSVLIVATTLYAFWNRPGAPIIDGIQGRYFIPLAPLIFLPMSSGRLHRPLDREWMIATFGSMAALVAGSLIVLTDRFY